MLCLFRTAFCHYYDSVSNTGLICDILKGYAEYHLKNVDEKYCDLTIMVRVCFTLQTSVRQEKEVCD